EAVHGTADAEALTALGARGFIDAQGRVLPPVATLVGTRPAIPAVSGLDDLPSSEAASARSAEQAFTPIGTLADLLLAARTTPLVLVATGALSATERRRFTALNDPDQLREIAEISGLARAVDRELRVTAAAERWLADSFAARWRHVVGAF